LDCLYVKRFRVLQPSQVSHNPSPHPEPTQLEPRRIEKGKSEDIRNIFTQLPPNHLLRNQNLLVRLAIVYGEADAHEVGQEGCAALLRAVWGRVWWWGEGAREGEPIIRDPVVSLFSRVCLD